jgi:murein tripeptide amidase MpaA
MKITSNFDSGNIEVLDASDPQDVQLAIRFDAGDEHMQWFHFRVTGAKGQALKLRFTNSNKASYLGGWENYQACASYDRDHWFRIPTTRYVDNELSIEHTPERDAIYYAYFAPYSHERHLDLIAEASCDPKCRLELLGQTLDGRDLDLLVIGDDDANKKPCWIIARQHPGESMAEWLMEGLLDRLLDEDDPVAKKLLEKAVFYVVPNMNPDGSARGHLRCNASGANLNREWETPTMEKSPEVYLVRQKMQATGLRFCLDVHGDEALPYNFIAGSEGVESVSPEMHDARDVYESALMRANPAFQREHGYPKDEPGQANMTMATNWIAGAFNALAMTLEQPFKDNKNAPNAETGWSPERCRKLGVSNLDALYAVIDNL